MYIFSITFSDNSNPTFVKSIRVQAKSFTQAILLFQKHYFKTKIEAIYKLKTSPSKTVGPVLT